MAHETASAQAHVQAAARLPAPARPAANQEAPQPASRRLELPTIIFGTVEMHRLQRELEALEDFLHQATVRSPGKQPALPRTSRIMETLAGNNNLNLLIEKDRDVLKRFLRVVTDKAPVINISFASDPSATFTAKIVAWCRTNVHPYALVRLGLQPTLAAGCVVRTTNKVFDFSLRNRFHEKSGELVAALNSLEEKAVPPPAAAPSSTEPVAPEAAA
jgi:hypothetical protein